MIARRIRVDGKVQGVWFRDWTVGEARAIGVTGWVRNCRDGAVEVLAIGDPDAVDRLIARLRVGSPASRVDAVHIEDAHMETVDGFHRRPSQ